MTLALPDASLPLAVDHRASLRWLLLSPPLVSLPQAADATLADFTATERNGITLWLDAMHSDASALDAAMAAKPEQRIGRYAERLMAFFLAHGPLHRMEAAQVPLVQWVGTLKVTRGELDFLLIDPQGQRLHWELAVKFFLCTTTATTASPTDFIGPNGLETLAQKWHKLFARQLAHRIADLAPAPWNTQVWQPQAFTRGWMFYRWGFAVPTCAALHPVHAKGWWIGIEQMADLPDAFYTVLPRLQWMAPLQCSPRSLVGASVVRRDALPAQLRSIWADSDRAPCALMVAQLTDSTAAHNGAYNEVQRFFVRPAGAAG